MKSERNNISASSGAGAWIGTLKELLLFALPTFWLMTLGTVVLLFEVWLVSRLGVEPLAGFSLCLPLAFLMTTMSAGGLGGGVTSAIARSQNSGNQDALIGTAVSLSLMIGLGFTVLLALRPQFILTKLSDDPEALSHAVKFASLFFAGAPLLWLANTLASIHRGLGQPAVSAKIGAFSAILQIAVSYPLILGVGEWQGLGLVGAALVPLAGYALQIVLQFRALSREVETRAALWPRIRLQRQHLADILWVGLPSSINTLNVALVSIQLTGLAAGLGTTALAAYGVSARIESMVMPVLFSIGTSMVALIGMAWGEGKHAVARRLLIVGTVLCVGVTSTVGLAMALAPLALLSYFSDSLEIAVASREYLRIAGPAIALLGLGLSFSFACQGIKRPLPALSASLARLALVSTGTVVLVPQSLSSIAWLNAASYFLFALILVGGASRFFRFRRFDSSQPQTRLHQT